MKWVRSEIGGGLLQGDVGGASRPVDHVVSRLGEHQRERLEQVFAEPVGYISNPSFARAAIVKELFGKGLTGQPWCNAACSAEPADRSTEPVHTLSAAEERRLFLRMNYARYRMSLLMKRIRSKRITNKSVKELLWWHARAMEARCRIVQANMPLVLAMARRTRLTHMDFAELTSEGNMALLRSVDKFDCSRGFKFSTYACRAILKSFSRVAMRTSRYRGRFPTEFDPTMEPSHHQADIREEQEADCVDELRGIMQANSADLNDVEYKVIQARFALSGLEGTSTVEPQTLEQVGLLIGVTKERVRQIQNKALAKLRAKLQEDFLAA